MITKLAGRRSSPSRILLLNSLHTPNNLEN
jgi:hypothetical protein